MDGYPSEQDRVFIRAIELLIGAAVRSGAKDVSIGAFGNAVTVSDNGQGWTQKAFRNEFPIREVIREFRLMSVEKLQIVSRSKGRAWSTDWVDPHDFGDAKFKPASVKAQGMTIVFTIGEEIENIIKAVRIARGLFPVRVKFQGKVLPEFDDQSKVWMSVETTSPDGMLILNSFLEGQYVSDGSGVCRKVSAEHPRGVFIAAEEEEVSREIYGSGLEAARSILIEETKQKTFRKPELNVSKVEELYVERCNEKGDPDRIRTIEFASMIGYAPITNVVWYVTKDGVGAHDATISHFSRRAYVGAEISKMTAAIMGTGGFQIASSFYAKGCGKKAELDMFSTIDTAAGYQIVGNYLNSEGVQIVIPCREIAMGKLQLPWAVVTPGDEHFIFDGEEMGCPDKPFMAFKFDSFDEIRKLLWNSPNLMMIYAWLLTEWGVENLQWCIYRNNQDEWQVNEDRIRITLLNELANQMKWSEKETESFLMEAKLYEHILDPGARLAAAGAKSNTRSEIREIGMKLHDLSEARILLWGRTGKGIGHEQNIIGTSRSVRTRSGQPER